MRRALSQPCKLSLGSRTCWAISHKLFLLLPRLLFFDDPNGSKRSLSEAIKLRCCLVLEGRWAELWKQVKEADAVERATSDAEADI